MARERDARRSRATTLLLVALLQAPAAGFGGGFLESFRDPEDGALDLSVWLIERKGFLPVPIFVTEPAVGYGGGLALLFFRQSIQEQTELAGEGGRVVPPDVFGGALLRTENGTRAAAGGGMFTFREDAIRFRGGVGWADVRLDFFGIGGDLGPDARAVAYELEGIASMQELLFRLGDSHHYLGGRWVYLDFESRLASAEDVPEFPDLEFDARGSGLGPSWEYDSRDNVFTPSRGVLAGLDTLFYREEIGSDTDYETYRGHVFSWSPLGERFVLGARVDGRGARGEVPFYQYPYISLRGIQAARFMDENVGVVEAELRWILSPRWAPVAFAGVGRAWGRRDGFEEADDQLAGGVGIRYLVARRLGLWAGLDVARGPEEGIFYIQVGSAWR